MLVMRGLVWEKIRRGRQLQRANFLKPPPHGNAFGIPLGGQAVEEQEPGDLIHDDSFTIEIRIAPYICAYIQCDYEQRNIVQTMKPIITSSVVAVSLALFLSAPSAFTKEREHEEEGISSSDVPAAVQQAAETEAKGGKIIRWEKEGANYEAVIEKGGKEWGYKFDAYGKMLGKHSEASEKGGKEEH